MKLPVSPLLACISLLLWDYTKAINEDSEEYFICKEGERGSIDWSTLKRCLFQPPQSTLDRLLLPSAILSEKRFNLIPKTSSVTTFTQTNLVTTNDPFRSRTQLYSYKIHLLPEQNELEASKRFIRERCFLTAVKHWLLPEYIGSFYESGPTGRPVIVTKYVWGLKLTDFFTKDRMCLVWKGVLAAFMDGLNFLHSHGITHRIVDLQQFSLTLPRSIHQDALAMQVFRILEYLKGLTQSEVKRQVRFLDVGTLHLMDAKDQQISIRDDWRQMSRVVEDIAELLSVQWEQGMLYRLAKGINENSWRMDDVCLWRDKFNQMARQEHTVPLPVFEGCCWEEQDKLLNNDTIDN